MVLARRYGTILETGQPAASGPSPCGLLADREDRALAIQNTQSVVRYTGNGTQSSYAVPFPFAASDHLEVTVYNPTSKIETVLLLGTDYSVSGVGGSSGTVTLLGSYAPLPSGHIVSIRRIPPFTQTTDIRNQGAYRPELHEERFDLTVMQLHRLHEELQRTLRLPVTDLESLSTLPRLADLKNRFLAFDAFGKPIASPAAQPAMPDVLWSFAGALATNRNDEIPRIRMPRAGQFVAFDLELVTAPSGSAVRVEFLKNDAIAATVEVAAGQVTASLVTTIAYNAGDVWVPRIVQVGSTSPGKTLAMRARGS